MPTDSPPDFIAKPSPPITWRWLWTDAILWLLVVALLWVALAVVIPKAFPGLLPKPSQHIVLNFKDSSELSAGSPVRLMGSEVGWVHSVRFKRDHVQVKLRFYPSAPVIPEGSAFTIEFTGIAGAKCIEINPHDSVSPSVVSTNLHNGHRFRVIEPIRMADVQRGGLLVMDSMNEGNRNIARALGSEHSITEAQTLLRTVDSGLDAGTRHLQDANRITQTTTMGMDHLTTRIIASLDQYQLSLNALQITGPSSGQAKEQATFPARHRLNSIKQLARVSTKLPNPKHLPQPQWNTHPWQQAAHRLSGFTPNATPNLTDPVLTDPAKLNTRIADLNNRLQTHQAKFSPWLARVSQQLHHLNETLTQKNTPEAKETGTNTPHSAL
jgi:hypothetical protein